MSTELFVSMDPSEEYFLDNLLDFEFDFTCETASCTSTDKSECSTGKRRGRGVAKASTSKAGAKCKNTTSKKKQLLDSEQPIEEVQIEYYTKPIYAFPSFDKSDALIYLPSTLTRYMNSGDMPAASKLLLSHLDKNCLIEMPHLPSGFLNTKLLVKMLDIVSDIHPDSIMCVHQTKVEGNQIWSSIYIKFTDCRAIRDSVRACISEPTLATILNVSREESVQKALQDTGRTEEEQQHFLALAETKEDILMYLRAEIVLTVDEVTKKVSQFSIRSRTTSMHLARNHACAAKKMSANSE